MKGGLRKGAFEFSAKWTNRLREIGETGMGYVVVSVTLIDGRKFDQVVINSGHLTRVRGLADIPFAESEIADIRQTDAKWDWSESP